MGMGIKTSEWPGKCKISRVQQYYLVIVFLQLTFIFIVLLIFCVLSIHLIVSSLAVVNLVSHCGLRVSTGCRPWKNSSQILRCLGRVAEREWERIRKCLMRKNGD